jgi:hypothetical protein
MKLFLISAVAMFGTVVPSRVVQQDTRTSIDGVVLRADTSQPLAGADVRLRLMQMIVAGLYGVSPTARAVPIPPDVTTKTDADGRFSFSDVVADTYHLFVVAPGYGAQEYGQTTPNSFGAPVIVNPGQRLTGLQVRLAPTGAVMGLINDDQGQPAVGTTVQILRFLSNSQGGWTTHEVATASVDAEGRYRIFGINPGTYYVGVSRRPIRSPDGQELRSPADYVPLLLYPGVTDLNQAIQVEVKAGSETAVNMKTRTVRSYHVRGTVLEGTTHQPPPRRANIRLSALGVNTTRSTFPVTRYDLSTGVFEIPNLPQGDYVIEAQYQDAVVNREDAWVTFPTARVLFTLSDHDLTDLVLTLQKPGILSGQVRVSGKTTTPFGRVAIVPTSRAEWTLPEAKVNSDGTFQVEGILPGEYTVKFTGFPQGMSVGSITFNGSDLLARPYRFSGTDAGRIEIVLETNTAQLSGGVVDEKLQVVPGAYVVLLPEQRSRSELYGSVRSDRDGRFYFTDVAPGTYKILALDVMPPLAYLDPAFIKRFEEQAKRVGVTEASNAIVDVRVTRNR